MTVSKEPFEQTVAYDGVVISDAEKKSQPDSNDILNTLEHFEERRIDLYTMLAIVVCLVGSQIHHCTAKEDSCQGSRCHIRGSALLIRPSCCCSSHHKQRYWAVDSNLLDCHIMDTGWYCHADYCRAL